MADSITTNVDLLAAEFILRSEFERLNTHARQSDNWASVHKRAWTEVKKDLARLRELTESDLDDTSELDDATLYKVLEIAYRTSDVEGDEIQAKRWRRAYEKELGEIQITSSSATLNRQPVSTTVYRR